MKEMTEPEPLINDDIKTSEQVVEIENLSIGFEKEKVLHNLSLKLYNGENLVVLGQSGSGKSVLIKCIVCLLTLDTGTIKVHGENVNELGRKGLAELRKKIGFLFQAVFQKKSQRGRRSQG